MSFETFNAIYHNFVRSDRKFKFTKQRDQQLMDLVDQYGIDWALISYYLGCAYRQAKNRFYYLEATKDKEE